MQLRWYDRLRLTVLAVCTAVIATAALAAGAGSPALASPAGGSAAPARGATVPAGMHQACGAVRSPLLVRCFALYRLAHQVRGAAAPDAAPAGWGAGDLQAAYNLPITRGNKQTIAIVDARDDPNAEADLAVYRSTYGLPPCTTANGCFKKVNQQGKASPLPAPDAGWALEISLDVQMVSAACPKCHILLVEGRYPSLPDLAAAEDTAARLGAAAISNSYGEREFDGLAAFAKHFNHPGTAIVASSGDAAFEPSQAPAVFTSVLAVGGTSLVKDSSARGWSETAWFLAGSGCSAYVPKPSWQHDPNCPMHTTADVSAVATGVATYATYGGFPGWLELAGTSVSSPLIAGVIGLAGNGRTFKPSYPYHHTSSLFDVVSGSTAFSCGGDYLCTALPGYDAPTGNGTPNGIGAF
ncbi:MAG: S53 family peptidase [Actinoallomurus sp.]